MKIDHGVENFEEKLMKRYRTALGGLGWSDSE